MNKINSKLPQPDADHERTDDPQISSPRTILRGPANGVVIAGVAGAIAARAALPAWMIRIAFVIATLMFGAGAIAYLVGWIVIPSESEKERSLDFFRALAIVAVAVAGGMLAFALMALVGVMTALGLGAFAIGALLVLLLLTALRWPRVKPAIAIGLGLTIVVPMVAVAATGVRLDSNLSGVSSAPKSVADIPAAGYSTGVGQVFIDLRKTRFPSGSTTRVPIKSGTGLVVVALPHTQCLRVSLTHKSNPFVSRLRPPVTPSGVDVTRDYDDLSKSAIGMNHSPPWQWNDRPLGNTNLFDRTATGRRAELADGSTDPRVPRLKIEVDSLTSNVFVRDYPDFIGPLEQPTWPRSGLVTAPPAPGDLRLAWRASRRGSSPRLARRWREWQQQMREFDKQMARLEDGPCAAASRR